MDQVYTITYAGSFSLWNELVAFEKRDTAITKMHQSCVRWLSDPFRAQNEKRTTQEELHDLDGYLTCIRCFADGHCIGSIELTTIQLNKD